MDIEKEFSYNELLCLNKLTELILNETDLNTSLKKSLNILSEMMKLKRGMKSY